MAPLRHLCKAALHDLVGAHALDALALVQHIAGAGLQQTGNGFQGGGFARAVGTDQGDDLARIDGEGDILYGVDVAIVDVDAVYLQ